MEIRDFETFRVLNELETTAEFYRRKMVNTIEDKYAAKFFKRLYWQAVERYERRCKDYGISPNGSLFLNKQPNSTG